MLSVGPWTTFSRKNGGPLPHKGCFTAWSNLCPAHFIIESSFDRLIFTLPLHLRGPSAFNTLGRLKPISGCRSSGELAMSVGSLIAWRRIFLAGQDGKKPMLEMVDFIGNSLHLTLPLGHDSMTNCTRILPKRIHEDPGSEKLHYCGDLSSQGYCLWSKLGS